MFAFSPLPLPTRYPWAASSSYCFILPSPFLIHQGFKDILSVDSSLYRHKTETAPQWPGLLSFSGDQRPLAHVSGGLSPLVSVHLLLHRLLSGSPGHQILTLWYLLLYKDVGRGSSSKVEMGSHPHWCPDPPRSKHRDQARVAILRASKLSCLPSWGCSVPRTQYPKAPGDVLRLRRHWAQGGRQDAGTGQLGALRGDSIHGGG